MDTQPRDAGHLPLLNPGSIFANQGSSASILCVIDVQSCNGECQDGTRIRATGSYVTYDSGAAFVLQPWVSWLVQT